MWSTGARIKTMKILDCKLRFTVHCENSIQFVENPGQIFNENLAN